MFDFPPQPELRAYVPLRSSDADCISWPRFSLETGCADEHGKCGHAMNCPLFQRRQQETDPL